MVQSETLTSEPPPITIMRRIWTGEAKAMWRMICSSASDLMRGNASHFRTKGFNTDQYRLGLVVDEELCELSQKKVSNLTDKTNILCPCLLFGMNPPKACVCVCVWLCVLPLTLQLLGSQCVHSEQPSYPSLCGCRDSIHHQGAKGREREKENKKTKKKTKIRFSGLLCFVFCHPPVHRSRQHFVRTCGSWEWPPPANPPPWPPLPMRICHLYNISVNVQSPLESQETDKRQMRVCLSS